MVKITLNIKSSDIKEVYLNETWLSSLLIPDVFLKSSLIIFPSGHDVDLRPTEMLFFNFEH